VAFMLQYLDACRVIAIGYAAVALAFGFCRNKAVRYYVRRQNEVFAR
jgi:hypothetical protein